MNRTDTDSAAVTRQGTATNGRQQLVAQSLHVGNPANKARDLPLATQARLECQIELNVDDIRAYEHNPRRAGNPRFAEIKESIRVSGVRNPIAVTRRPGEAHFIVEAGGNTRLAAVQALWAETGDVRFSKLTVLFRPWHCESHVLIAHLIENDQRADMTFWDKASGVAALKLQLEVEQSRSLSLRQLESALQQAGISIGYVTLCYYGFATDRLQGLGDAVQALSGMDVAKLQPRLNLLKRYAVSRSAMDEDACYARILEPVFKQHAAQHRQSAIFSADQLCRDCEAALALHLGESAEQCRKALALLARLAAATPSCSPRVPEAYPEDATPPPLPVARGDPEGWGTVQSLNSLVASPPLPGTAALTSAVDLPPVTDAVALRAVSEEARLRLVEQIGQFARLAGASDSLRVAATAPLGLVVSPLVRPGVAGGLTQCQRWGWWLLALICGQFSRGNRAAVPDDAEPCAPYGAMSPDWVVTGADAELVIDLPFLLWLLDPDDAAVKAFRRVVALLAQFPADAPLCRISARMEPVAQRHG